MTRFLLFFISLFFSTLSFAQTLIPDTNFEQFLVDEGIDTNGITGDILNADAQAVTDLNVTRNDITDFTGIEAFVNIVTLNTGGNQYSTIPLSTLNLLESFIANRNNDFDAIDFTQNPALTTINIRCNFRPELTLTTLDLSQNLNLASLTVEIPSLTDLTFPVTVTLVDIDIYNCSLPIIDLSKLEGDLDFYLIGSRVNVNIIQPDKRDALKRYHLSSVDFQDVDISEMIGLERFQLSSTFTETIQLPTTSTLTNISISVHELDGPISFASVPELTNLSITNKWDSGNLQVDLSQNLELTYLDLNRNKMNSVDVSNNTKLIRLNLNNNNLTTLDLSQNTLLTDINAGSNQLPNLDVSSNTEVTTLNASNNLLPSIDLSTNLKLRYLYLGFNQISTLDITNNTALWITTINNNLFTGSGLDLTQNTEMFSLTASFNQIETLDITQNSNLRSLNISDNIFPGTDILNQFYTHQVNQGRLSMNLNVENNLLSGRIPHFYGLYTPTVQTRRSSFQFGGNSFQFGDFEDEHLDYVALLTTQSLGPSPDVVFSTYTYAPQEKVNAIENPTRNAGESITLTTTVRGTQNHYKWFKDGVEILDAPDSPELILNDLNTCDTGVYYAEITSDLVPFENSDAPGTNGKNLLLVRNDIDLTVNATKACVTLDMPLTEVPINSGIQWNDNPGACGYKITLGTTSGATDVVNNEDVGEVTVYNLATDLNPNQDYFVTITPYYDDGDFTCTEQSFRTNTSVVAPDCTFISSPLNDDTNIATDLSRIEWNPANGADEYNVTISSPSGANDITTTTTETFLPLSNNFAYGEVVTVTIIPENSIGTPTDCSPENFTITNSTAVTTSTNAFVTTWKTDNTGLTNDNEIRIPTFGTGYNYTVDWGDGNTTTETGVATHTYASSGIYTVSISGDFPRIYFDNSGDREKILTIEQWGDIEWTSMELAFTGCTNLTGNFSDAPNLSNVTNMVSMFRNCTNYNSEMSNWDTSNVVNMARVLERASSFNQNITNWNTSSVLNMSGMFRGASNFNQDISFKAGAGFPTGDAWDVSQVTNMQGMLDDASVFNQNIGNWNVQSVIIMSSMLRGATAFNQDIGGWNVANATNLGELFRRASSFNQDISSWEVGQNQFFRNMFDGATAFNQDISGWDTSSAILMREMFKDATSFDQNIGGWDVDLVNNMENMFQGVTLSTANYDALLIGWNSQNLQPNVMFSGGNSQYCDGATARANMIASDTWTITDGGTASPTVDDLADQNQANSYTLPAITGTQLTGTEAYFTDPNGTGTQYNAGDTINFADFPNYPVTLYIYDGSGSCSSEENFELTITSSAAPGAFITTWETTVTNETITVPTFNTETYDYDVDWGDGNIDTNVNGDATHTYTTPGIHTVSITGVFPRIYFNNAGDKDKILTIEQWGNIEWTSMESAFYGCTNLNITNPSIDAPDLSRVTSLENTFRDTWQFNGMVNNWNTENVTTLRYMFGNSFLFNQDISNWDVRQVENMSFMFSQASFNQSLNNWQTDSLIDLRGMFSRASAYNQPMDNWNTENVTIMFGTFSEASSFNQDLSAWNVDNVTTMRSMFDNALAFNQDISGWNVGNVTEMRAMFRATPFNQDIGGWDVGNVTTMQDMFVNATNFDQNLGNWDVSSLNNASSMFSGVQLSTANYDALLIGWNTRVLIADVVFDGGNSLYCNGAAARSAMTRNDNWTITDGGTTGPEIESIIDQNSVDNFTFPAITGTQLTGGEAYYTEPNGGGTRFDTGDVINFVDFPIYPVTIYIYDSSGTCFDEESFALNITNTGTTPACTSLIAPANEDTDVSVATDLTWNAVTDADGYRLTIGTTAGGNDILDNEDVGNLLTYNPPNDLPGNTEIFVTIVPYIGMENATGCTEESFTTEIAQPGCANLITPTFDATDVPIDTNLTWNTATNAVRYSIAIGTSTGLDDILATTDVGNNTTFDPPADLPANTRVFVTITSFNAADESIVCGDDQFTTGDRTAVLPDCTALSSPLNGDSNVSADTDISWNAVANADGYRLTVGSSPGGNDIIDNFDAGDTLTFDFSGPFAEGITVYITITPYNMDGDALNCAEESFTISSPIADVLSCTVLTTPLNGATDVIVDTNIAWNEVLNANGYRLSVGTTAGGNDILDNEDVGILTLYQLPNNLPFEQQIFVTIIPYNADGDAENCEEQSFTTIAEVSPEIESLNGLSPDGDGINEFWRIEGIEEYPNNTVVIYNRWGDMVYKVEGYNNTTNTFNGEANQLNGLGASQLPEGTYFFNIIIPETNNLKQTKGYLVLKR